MTDWEYVRERLCAFPPNSHRFRAPCPLSRIKYLTELLGTPPDLILSYLENSNGAELFVNLAPLVTLFAVSPVIGNEELDWARDWYIDVFTSKWRMIGNATDEWAIGLTNYGGLLVLSRSDTIREWDTSTNRWNGTAITFRTWCDSFINEGAEYLTV